MENFELLDLFEQTFPFWNRMSEEDRETFLRSSQHVSFGKGMNIHDGNQCTGIILVKSGSLRLYILSEEGKEITLYRLFPGDMCILSASCVLQSITFDVFIDSEEDSDCIVIGGCAYEDLARRMPEAKIFALESALSRFSDVMWVMQQILFMSMDKRLAIFLLDETAKTGTDTIKLTHEQIAKYMGSAREVVSRMLKYFAAEGLLTASRSGGIRILDKSVCGSLRGRPDSAAQHRKNLMFRTCAGCLTDNFAVFHHDKSRDADDTEGSGDRLFFIDVDFSDEDIVAFLRDVMNDGSDHPAGTAPVGVEVEEDGFLGIFYGIEVEFIYFHYRHCSVSFAF